MFGLKILGKTRLPHHKSTADIAPVKMTPPKEVLLLTSQHIGTPATPVVKVGDEVKVGQLIAEASGEVSANIHASVSGKVTKIDTCLLFNGRVVPAIRIESDGLMTPYEGITPPEVNSLEDLVNAVRTSGLVGLGGAGFPTAVKLGTADCDGCIHTIIINGAECEPYLTSDSHIMSGARSSDLYEGISLIKKFVPSVQKFIFGIENNKPESIEQVARMFQDDETVSVYPLPSLYPQGEEKVLVYNTTGLVIPEGKRPFDIGVLVINVTSLAVLAQYVRTGMPLVTRCVTVDGTAVAEPKNVLAPIGTSLGDIIEFAGGLKEEAGKVIFGGPMMGYTASSLDEPITKTTGGITVLTVKDSTEREATACIHCGRCLEACPINLNPTAFAKALSLDNNDDKIAKLEENRVNLCMECGSCSYVCPANRPLVQNNRLGKAALREYNERKATIK